MNEPAITFDNISKDYSMYHHLTGGIKNFIFNLPKLFFSKKSKFKVLENVSFSVEKGETLGIIGRNGVGKSTILGLIAGVLKPTAGKVVVRGKISPLLELGAGFHPDLTGRENIVLNGVLLGLTKAEVVSKIEEIIKFSELEDFIDQPIRSYSSGMLARLGFSVASTLDPQIILIDEVLAVGDEAFQKKCIDKMMNFKKRGVTIVFVSHQMNYVKKICDKVLWIDNHQIQKSGSPEEVISKYIV